MTTIHTICVCGAGTMGSGIAQVAATAGFATILYELNADVLHAAKQKMEATLQMLVDKQRLTVSEKEEAWQRLTFTSNLADCRADLVVEAIIEKPEIKEQLFKALVAVNDAQTVFASNTSSLSISDLASAIPQPQRFVGLHFFNPAPVMKLVEVIRGRETADDVIETLVALTKKMGKTPVVCKDAPGFIVNRVARPFYIETLRLAEEGVITYEAADKLLQSRGFKLGPFALMDLIGNDVNYAVSCSVYEQLGNPDRLQPSYLQKEKVAQGALGRKTKKGYYTY